LNPDTGAVIASIALDGVGRFVHAAQGQTLWGHCSCGERDPARVPTSGAALDVVPAFTLTGSRPQSLAYDEIAQELWAVGREDQPLRFEISRFKSDEEPDRLIDSRPFQQTIRAISFDAGRLWGLTSAGDVVEFSPATAKAVRTFNNPDRRVFWAGLAVSGDRVFLSGQDQDQQGVLVEARR
jgi:hypothetical protein